MLLFNFNNWQFWGEYDPANGRFGEQKVAFDGPNRIIYIAEGVTEIDVQEDLYSAWKEWSVGSPEEPHATSWPRAFTAVGGDPVTDVQTLGTTYFLENGWRIQPFPSKLGYVLTIQGNIYTRESGGSPFLFAEGVSTSLVRSNIVDLITIETMGTTIEQEDIDAIRDAVWNKALDEIVSTDTTGDKLKKDLTVNKYLALQK